MNYNKIKLYYKTLLLKRGLQVSVFPTYKCNFKCEYCGTLIPSDGKHSHGKESTLQQWIEFIERFPCKIREFYLSRGEPTLYKDFVPLVNYLLMKGHVKVFTNLTHPEKFLQIPKTYKLNILATFHHTDDKDRFDKAYKSIYPIHRIDVDEIDYWVLPYSRVKPFLKPEDYNDVNFRISCDLKVFIGCWDHYKKMAE